MRRPDNRRWRCWISALLLPILTVTLLLMKNLHRSPSSPATPSSATTTRTPLPPLPILFYFISGTAHDSSRLKRLLLATYHPNNRYLLHLDLAASDDERSDLSRFILSDGVIAEVGNVRVVEKEDSDQVTENGPTKVACLLHAVARALKEGWRWDWFVNLGAEDYPLMPQDDILHIFSFLPRDLNFIEHTSEIGWKESQRVRPMIVDPGLYAPNKTSVLWVKERRALPSSFKLFVGSAGVVLTKSFLEFCIWGWDNLPRTLLMYYTNFLSSPESYFHSVICNSKDFQNTTVNHDLRYVMWDNPPGQKPANITEEGFDLMVESGAPFLHEVPNGSPVLDRIDQELLRRWPGQFTPGGWCLERTAARREYPCSLRGKYAVIRPTSSFRRLESLLMRVLDPEIFRSSQCK